MNEEVGRADSMSTIGKARVGEGGKERENILHKHDMTRHKDFF